MYVSAANEISHSARNDNGERPIRVMES